MENKKLFKYLKKLKEIEPESDFLKRSRSEILAEARPSFYAVPLFYSKKYLIPVSLSLVFLLFVGVVYFLKSGPDLSIASAETIIKEFEGMPINITLKNIKYDKEINNTIEKAVSIIAKNKSAVFNTEELILNSEIENINTSSVSNNNQEKIEELLNKILND
jgi:hypothetical protein